MSITTQPRNIMFLVLELNYHRLFIIYFSQIQDGDIQDGDVQDGVPFLYFVQAPLFSIFSLDQPL